MLRKYLRIAAAAAVAGVLVAGCGGGGGSGNSSVTPPAAATLELLAGLPPTGGASVDGTGVDARFTFAAGIVADSGGTLYVADSQAYSIRKVTQSGVVTTFAGTLGASGFADGTGSAARFGDPTGLAIDRAGNIYVADRSNNRIRKITSQGVVTTLAGGDSAGSADGPGADARFEAPLALATDAQGNVYVAEQFRPRIRKITPGGLVSTIAGSADRGKVDGPAASARFDTISALAVDASGNLFIADDGNHLLRKLGIDGNVTTLSGIGLGPRTAAIAVDDAGAVYVGGLGLLGGGSLERILPSGEVTSLSVSAVVHGIAMTHDGRVYYTDAGSVYQVAASGAITTFVGRVFGSQAQTDGIGGAARFESLTAIAVNPAGDLHVIDGGSIRKVTRGGAVTTQLSGLQALGIVGLAADEADATYYALWTYCDHSSPPGCFVHSTIEKLTAAGQRIPIVATASSDGSPLFSSEMMGLTRDSGGTLYFSQIPDGRILRLDAGGNVTTIAGGVNGYADGVGAAARFSLPTALALDRSGNLYVADTGNAAIRKIAPDRTVTTPGGPGAANGVLYSPYGVAVDASGNVYVADTGNHVVRKITPSGAMSILVGQLGRTGFAPGALPGLIESPMAVVVVGTDLYIAMHTSIAVVHNLP